MSSVCLFLHVLYVSPSNTPHQQTEQITSTLRASCRSKHESAVLFSNIPDIRSFRLNRVLMITESQICCPQFCSHHIITVFLGKAIKEKEQTGCFPDRMCTLNFVLATENHLFYFETNLTPDQSWTNVTLM